VTRRIGRVPDCRIRQPGGFLAERLHPSQVLFAVFDLAFGPPDALLLLKGTKRMEELDFPPLTA
jgi:hypothetical protein